MVSGTQDAVSKLNLSDNPAYRFKREVRKVIRKGRKEKLFFAFLGEILCVLCVSKAVPSRAIQSFDADSESRGHFLIGRFADRLAQAATEFTFASSARRLWCLPE